MTSRLVLWLSLIFVALSCVVLGCDSRDRISLVGTLERKTLELAAPISEVIVEQPLKVGERVIAGQVIVQLDAEVATAELRAYEAALAAAQASLTESEGELQRIDDLRKARVKTPQDLDKARRQRDEARAVVAEKEARVTQARKRLEDLTVRSRATGVLDQLPYEVGERAPAGGVVAVVLADEEPWVRVWMPARAVSRIAANHPAEARIEGLETWFKARIEDVSREPGFTPHYALTERETAHLVYEARVVLTDAPDDLRPGLPARVRLHLADGKPAS